MEELKKLSIEQKAKRYDEILARAKGANIPYYKDDIMGKVKEFVDYLIPELNDSEDEKIKEQVVYAINQLHVCECTKDKLLAWLEKQCEQNQKHFELKAGHWYICHRAFCCRADHLTIKEGERFMCEKDGIAKGFVFKEPEQYFREVCAPAPIEDEQKSIWTEEDERILKAIIINIENLQWSEEIQEKYYHTPNLNKNYYQIMVDWLKFIKYRVQSNQEYDDMAYEMARAVLYDQLKNSLSSHSQWKPSDEQITWLYRAVDDAGEDSRMKQVLNNLLSDLKKLKEK